MVAMGRFPPKFSESLAPKLLVRLKNQQGAKMVRTSSISRKVWWRAASARRREKEKFGVFFLCLFVCHALDLELEYRIGAPEVQSFKQRYCRHL